MMEKAKQRKAHRPSVARTQNRPQAATRDVVSPPPRTARINPKWETHQRRLTELRNYFLAQRGTLVQDSHEQQSSYSEHMADAGTDSYDRDFALSMLSSDQNALYEIDQALHRIEAGTYAICEVTGKPIQRERLNAIPWTRFSLEAEQQLEQRGIVNRTRLGSLGSVAEGVPGEEEPSERESRETTAEDSDNQRR
jgi:DnaK suppressor protein